MALTHIPTEKIDQSHLQALLDTGAAESQYIDYKRETFGSNDDARAEFLADVSSFANTAGGDLIIGMTAVAGVPTGFAPFNTDADAERLRLESMARTGLEPRITGLQTRPVSLSGGGCAIVIRVPRSYNPPHRVIFKNRNRFWARSSVGKYEPNVDQLRDLFTLAPHLAERIREFRLDRVARIAVGDTPVPLIGGAILVVHVIPFSAFALGQVLPLVQIQQQYNLFPPMRLRTPNNYRMNFDGLLTLSNADEKATSHRAYVQVFRSGMIETVASSIERGQGLGILKTPDLEDKIINATYTHSSALREFGIEPPMAVLVSLLNIKGRQIITTMEEYWPESRLHLDRDQLHCAEVILEAVPENHDKCAFSLCPILDQLANAAGLPSSKSFRADGTFSLHP